MSWPRPSFGVLLITVVLAGFWLRLQHCYMGLPYLHFWDEPQTASTALRMLRSGELDPHFFHYGSLMIYLSLGVDIVHAISLVGAAPGSPEALPAVGNILINDDTGWHWTISHPSFYFWNRVLVAAMGAGTVALVGLIGRRIAGPLSGLAAATLLAGASVHIAESTVITNDAPLTFFVLYSAYEALRYRDEERLGPLLRSLVAVGLAIGCKYTAGMSLILPLLCMGLVALRPGATVPAWLWPTAIALPAATFLLTTPYVLVNLPDFVNHVGYELRHYQVLGHGESTIQPGWPNLAFQLDDIWSHLGILPCLLALGGILSIRRRNAWMIFLLPVVYAIYMSNMRINFTRNFLLLYPFIALSVGAALAGAQGRIPEPWRGRFAAGVGLLGLLWLGAALPAATAARIPETRSAMLTLLAQERWSKIGIPEELRVHGIDLGRLGKKKDVQVAPLRSLLCDSDREVVVVPVQVRADGDPLEAATLSALLPPVERALLHGPPGRGEIWLDRPTLSPQLRVVAPLRTAACNNLLIRASELIKPGAFPTLQASVLLTMEGQVYALRPLPPGRWVAHWLLRGTPAAGELPEALLGAPGALSSTVNVGPEWAEYTVAFEQNDLAQTESKQDDPEQTNPKQTEREAKLSLDFLNDAFVDGEDRNIEVAGLWIRPD